MVACLDATLAPELLLHVLSFLSLEAVNRFCCSSKATEACAASITVFEPTTPLSRDGVEAAV
jgi:hypothetical protein